MLVPLCLAMTSLVAPQQQATTEALRIGHWLEIRGTLTKEDTFVAEKAELLDPEDKEVLIGTVQVDRDREDVFFLLGQPVFFSNRTDFRNVDSDQLDGQRVKVEGHWRGPARLSAREVSRRGEGRERIAGRVDELWRTKEGTWARIMRYSVLLPPGTPIEHEKQLDKIGLAPPRVQTTGQIYTDENDFIGPGVQLTDDLRLDLQATFDTRYEDDYNFDADDAEDRHDTELSVRPRLVWQPSNDFTGVATGRYRVRWRDDQDDETRRSGKFTLSETFGYWRNLLGPGWDLAVGRQDFDEQREWIYDQNLDAVRAIYRRPDLRFEGSVSTILFDGSRRDENSTNLIAYLSNNQPRRQLAAWAIYRDVDESADEELLFGGIRANGRWIPQNRMWVELAGVVGEIDDTDVEGWGYDVGTTWKPDFADPFNITIGYAFGRGDSDPGDGQDKSFRQTGFQDNNDRFGGVSSFRYYGEIVDPELSNLGIFTLGVGMRIGERTSLDVVYHDYTQDYAQPFLLDSDLEADPTGIDADLGWGLDVILASRRWEHWDLRVIGSYFSPGDAFTEEDDAYLGRIRLRYRL